MSTTKLVVWPGAVRISGARGHMFDSHSVPRFFSLFIYLKFSSTDNDHFSLTTNDAGADADTGNSANELFTLSH